MASVKIPTDFEGQNKLFKLIYEKHVEDGDNSPLKDYAMTELNNKNEDSEAINKNAKDYIRMSEEQTKERNLTFEDVSTNIRAIAAFLKAKNRINPKKMGEWGFTVVGD